MTLLPHPKSSTDKCLSTVSHLRRVTADCSVRARQWIRVACESKYDAGIALCNDNTRDITIPCEDDAIMAQSVVQGCIQINNILQYQIPFLVMSYSSKNHVPFCCHAVDVDMFRLTGTTSITLLGKWMQSAYLSSRWTEIQWWHTVVVSPCGSFSSKGQPVRRGDLPIRTQGETR